MSADPCRALAGQLLVIMLPVGTTLVVTGLWLTLAGHLDTAGSYGMFELAAIFVAGGLCGVAIECSPATVRRRPPAKLRGR